MFLVTGASGYAGSELIHRLQGAGRRVRAFGRDAARMQAAGVRGVEIVTGDVVSGAGLQEALAGVDVAWYLIHSMETAAAQEGFAVQERRAAENFAQAARAAGVRRIVYLGGMVPPEGAASPHLASRLEVERVLLDGAPEAVALRASIIVAARSRSFRFLVRLLERVPVLPLPAWRDFRTQPIDGRDVIAFLAAAGTSDAVTGQLSLDIAGPDVVTYGELIERIGDALLLDRPRVNLSFNLTPLASVVAATIAGEDLGLIAPLMGSLEADLLPRDDRAPELLGVRLHRLDAAIDRALRDWEQREELAAR